jgi:hypothetical protein
MQSQLISSVHLISRQRLFPNHSKVVNLSHHPSVLTRSTWPLSLPRIGTSVSGVANLSQTGCERIRRSPSWKLVIMSFVLQTETTNKSIIAMKSLDWPCVKCDRLDRASISMRSFIRQGLVRIGRMCRHVIKYFRTLISWSRVGVASWRKFPSMISICLLWIYNEPPSYLNSMLENAGLWWKCLNYHHLFVAGWMYLEKLNELAFRNCCFGDVFRIRYTGSYASIEHDLSVLTTLVPELLL